MNNTTQQPFKRQWTSQIDKNFIRLKWSCMPVVLSKRRSIHREGRADEKADPVMVTIHQTVFTLFLYTHN